MATRFSISAAVLSVLLMSACKAPIPTINSHPFLPDAQAECIQDGGKVWLQLTVPHEPSEGQWFADFRNGTPESFNATPANSSTQFKWLVPPDKVTIGGLPGFPLTLKNDKKSYGIIVTVRPTYSVVLQGMKFPI